MVAGTTYSNMQWQTTVNNDAKCQSDEIKILSSANDFLIEIHKTRKTNLLPIYCLFIMGVMQESSGGLAD